MSNLTKLARRELDAIAAELGIADPDALPNREAVIDAIEGQQPDDGDADGFDDADAALALYRATGVVPAGWVYRKRRMERKEARRDDTA